MAAEAGKHILCEKPLTLTLQQSRQAVEICRRNKVFLQEGYMMKFHGAHQEIKRIVEEGRLGRIVYMRAQLSCWYPKIKGAWRQNPRLGGGGALIDMATHMYDLLEYFAGPIRRIAAIAGTLVQDYRSDDASTTIAEFKSGAHATIDCFYCIPDEASRTRLEIYGSKGAILAEGTIGQSEKGKVEAYFSEAASGYDASQDKDVARTFEKIPFKPVNPYTAECDYFARCVLEGRPPAINDGKNAIHIMSLVEKAYQSWKTKRFLTV
jgi:predicted dehydrogenase